MQLSHSKLEAFTGNVFDQATGKPIAGAEVHYLDDNPPMDMKGKPLRGIIRGTVTTGLDGSYRLPADLPLATYAIRVIAPGYYADKFHGSGRIVRQNLPAIFREPSHEIHLRPSNAKGFEQRSECSERPAT
jgi:hypothetical protein